MKNFEELKTRLRNELDQWFIRQCRNTFSKYYLYYLETTAEHDGGIAICSEDPPNKEYKLATTEHIQRHLTVEQNFYRLVDVASRLPVLS